MVRIILIIFMSGISLIGFSQDSNSKDENLKVTAEINNIIGEGTVHYSIYESKEKFNKRIPLVSKGGKVINGKSSVVFNEITKGYYAILCYHDENDNGKMDFSESGMPLENYGMSNNVALFGPPNFEDAKFEVSNKDLIFEIKFQ